MTIAFVDKRYIELTKVFTLFKSEFYMCRSHVGMVMSNLLLITRLHMHSLIIYVA